MFVFVGAYDPRFLGANTVNTIFAGRAYIAMAATGMSLVIISGHIDVSTGALIGAPATISGTLATHGLPVWAAWLVPLVAGAAVDAVVGVLVAKRASRPSS